MNEDTKVESAAADDSPIQAPMHVSPPKDPELKALWQEYLQKCCEAGQIEFQISQLDSQRRQMEKNLDATKQAIKRAAHKHKDLHAKIMADSKPQIVPQESEVQGGH